MASSLAHPLSFEEFRQLVAKELQIDLAQVTPQATFIEDLQVDSIHMVELMLRLEELGITIPLEQAWEIHTVEDAYRCYRNGLATSTAQQTGDQQVPAPSGS